MVLGLCLIFFVSGASALVFETLWFRAAGLTLDYDAAARLLAQALRQDPESNELARLRILALVLAGHQEDARASSLALRAREGEQADPRF